MGYTNAQTVSRGARCPKCGEDETDRLIWREDVVKCATCGTIYSPEGL